MGCGSVLRDKPGLVTLAHLIFLRGRSLATQLTDDEDGDYNEVTEDDKVAVAR